MFGSLQTTGWSGAGPFRSMAIIATIAGSILVADSAHCGTPQIVDETAHARPAAHGPCLADPRYFAPADVAIRPSWRVLPCMREEAAVCAACATCAPDAWCAPVKTRGIGPRSPGGGPDD